MDTAFTDREESRTNEEGRRKAEHLKRVFEEIDAILDGDTGWASEEEMIADLAEFRRKREAERRGHVK